MEAISSIIGIEGADNLRSEFIDTIQAGGDYEDVEYLLSGYGLEMDYVEQLMF